MAAKNTSKVRKIVAKEPRSNSTMPEMSTRTQARRSAILNDRMDVLGQIPGFRQFVGSSFEPVITDVEIIVCFADIRGFTTYCRDLQKEMQDRKIQNFLRTYIKIFAEGLMRWFGESSQKGFTVIK
jgi:hypothetical protein